MRISALYSDWMLRRSHERQFDFVSRAGFKIEKSREMSRLEKINEIFLEYSQRIEQTKEYAREMISYSARLESFR